MAWTYSKRADKLDLELAKEADKITAAKAAEVTRLEETTGGHTYPTDES